MAIRRSFVALVTVLCVLVPTAARAASVDDADAARGPLDLHRLTATKHDAGAPLHITIVTYRRWRASLIRRSGPNRLHVLFQTDKAAGADYVGEIFSTSGRLKVRVTTAGGSFVRSLAARHPKPNVVRLTVPRGLPNPDGNLKLAATMTYRTASGACSSTCHDRIPDDGWLKVTPGR